MTRRLLVISAIVVSMVALWGAPAAAQAPKAQAPVLLTSCGQSPGPDRVKVFLMRLGVQYEYKTDATAKDLAAGIFKTVIIVTGSSLKGMGAAGVSITDELKRTEALIAEAKKRGVMIIGAHVEGMERRARNAAPGDNSDEQSIDTVCPKSAILIVRKDGDEDGRFTTIAKSKNIPLLLFEKNLELSALLKNLFAK